MIHADRPIQTASEDCLGRADFSRRLAKQIAGWRGQESLVIGLYGDWGTGKSSVKNLVLESLASAEQFAPDIVELNPWMVSGEEKITQSFFDEICAVLENVPTASGSKARVASWKKYARLLDTASKLAGAFDLISPALGIIAPGAGAWAAKRLKAAKDLAEDAAGSLEQQTASLQTIKKELRESFNALPKPLLVVIDDIDRLTAEEICLVLRLVKANADFPNTVYLLLSQRDSIEAALDKIASGKGKQFLEKIVQIGFDLPTPPIESVHRILQEQLDQIMGPFIRPNGSDSANGWKEQRWTDVWVAGLSHYFTNLREVYRFLNSFRFMVSAFAKDSVLEVNTIDLIAIECLRVFESEWYREIRDHKSLLTAGPARLGGNEKKSLEEWLRKLSEVPSKKLHSTIVDLFPEIASLKAEGLSFLVNRMYGHDERSQWTSQRRVCVPEFFDRYFQLSLPAGQVSESTIQEILSLKENRDALVGIFTQLQEQEVLVSTLARLESERSLSTMPDPMPYLLALSDISDRISGSKATGFSVSGQQLIRFAINRVLLNISDLNRKIEIVTGLITEGNGVTLSALLIGAVVDPKESSPYPRFQSADLVSLKDRWMQRVRALAADGHLLDISDLQPLLYGWLDWSDPKEAKDWVVSLSQDPKKLLSFLHTHISRSTVQGVGSYHVRHRSWISWTKDLQRFMSQEDWRKAGDLLARSEDLSDEERQTLSLFQKAMNCWEKEIDDTQFNDAVGFTV